MMSGGGQKPPSVLCIQRIPAVCELLRDADRSAELIRHFRTPEDAVRFSGQINGMHLNALGLFDAGDVPLSRPLVIRKTAILKRITIASEGHDAEHLSVRKGNAALPIPDGLRPSPDSMMGFRQLFILRPTHIRPPDQSFLNHDIAGVVYDSGLIHRSTPVLRRADQGDGGDPVGKLIIGE